MTKPRLDSFAEKISPAQSQQLIEWLAEHTYFEVCDLVAAEPPTALACRSAFQQFAGFIKRTSPPLEKFARTISAVEQPNNNSTRSVTTNCTVKISTKARPSPSRSAFTKCSHGPLKLSMTSKNWSMCAKK